MSHREEANLAELGRKLEARERELRDEIRGELLQSEHAHYRDLAGMVSDAGDESVASMLADLDAAFIDRHVCELRRVEAARDRLKDGTYGRCTDCSEAIAWQRLLVEPASTRCVPCAERHDRARKRAQQPSL